MFDRTLLPSPSVYYGQLFTLKGSKTQVLVPCCFHHDKSPSLSINLIKGTFNCLGCGAKGGDVLDFHKLKHGLNTIEGAKDLGAWIDTKGDTQDELAARKKKIEQADRDYKTRQEQAAKAEKAHAQAFIPLLANILKQCQQPMLETPYCVAKGIGSHNLLSITAPDIQRFTLPVDPHEPTKRPVTVCYGFEGVLTVAILETFEGEQVALQVFDGVPDDKNKYARWLIGKPVVMGAYYRLGDWTSPSVVLITEGIADAISCYEATGYPVLAAISKSQLLKAALAIKRKYPHALVVICGDNDADGGGQRAAIDAAQAVNGVVVIPSGFKDFNDLHQAQGLEVVRMTIDAAIDSKKAAPSDTEDAAQTTNTSHKSIDDGLNGGDPLPIRQRLANVMPFNADLLPDSLRDYVLDEADRMPCPPDFVATALITAIGAVTGAGCGIKPKQKDDWLIVPNFWGGGIAPPTSKKTPAIDAGIKPLDRLIVQARESYESDLKAYEKEMMLYKANVEGLESDLKSASKTSAKNKVKHTPQELVELICQAKENEPQPPILRRYKTNDCTIERLGELERDNPNGVLVLRDELIGLLASLDKEGREGDRAFYLEGFNGTGSYDTDRIMRGNIYIESHCLSVFGGIQPDKLIAYLEQANSGLGNDGLLQRFQLLVYPDPIEWQYRDRYPNKEAANAVFEIFKRLSETDFIEFGAYPIDDYNKRPYFRFTLDAQAFYVEWAYRLNTQKIKQEESSLIQQHLGKYEKLLPALALVFHLVDCVTHHKQGQVSLEAIQKAAAWCEYLETHARRAYGLLLDGGMKSAIALTAKIMHIVKSPTAKTDETPDNWLKHGFVLRDIRRKQWQYLTDDNAIQKALTILSDNYWLTSKMQQSTEKGGRPTMRYFISQKLEKANLPTAKTDETQKSYNFGDTFAEKTGFGSFGSDLTGNNENLENINDVDLDAVISANSHSLDDDFDLFDL